MASGNDLDVYFLGCVDFEDARTLQEELVNAVLCGDGKEGLICCEHFPVLSFGKSQVVDRELCSALGIRGVKTDRGGLLTYHCPGQLVIYPVVDLRRRRWGLRKFVEGVLRELAIVSNEFFLSDVDVECYPRMDCVGLWASRQGVETKIGFAGLRVQNGITNHGFSLNVDCEIEPFRRFSPCGLAGIEVSSLVELSGRHNWDCLRFAHQVCDRLKKFSPFFE